MKSILLVEDDPFLIDIYSSRLKLSDFEVTVAPDGEVAIQKLKEKVPDVVLVDIVLPKMDGWQVLEEIKKMKIEEPQKYENMKIVILSNLDQKEDIEKGLALGAVKHLIKAHYTPSEVVTEIENLL